MRFKSQISWIVALICLLSFGAQTRAAAITAHDIVRQTTTDVMTVVEEAKGYAEEDPERYYKAIQDIFEGVVRGENGVEVAEKENGLPLLHSAQEMEVPHIRLFRHTMDGEEATDSIQNHPGHRVGPGLVVGVAVLAA